MMPSLRRLNTVQARYLFAGGWNTLFGMAIFAVLLFFLEDKIGYIGVLTLATPISIIQAHAVQRRFVWQTSSLYKSELLRFTTVYITQYLLNVMLLIALVEKLDIEVFKAQVIVTAILIFVSFNLNRRWTFSSSKDF